jgi:hypothetical protein
MTTHTPPLKLMTEWFLLSPLVFWIAGSVVLWLWRP